MKIKKINEFINNVSLLDKVILIENEFKHSSDSDIVKRHKDYNSIIESENIILILLNRIDETNLWYSTLVELTGVDHNDYIRSSSEKNSFWKNWAKQNGYKRIK